MGLLLSSLHRAAGVLSWEQEEGPRIHFIFEEPFHVEFEPVQLIRPWVRAAGQRARAWAAASEWKALEGLYDADLKASFSAHKDPQFADKGLLLLIQTGSMQSGAALHEAGIASTPNCCGKQGDTCCSSAPTLPW